MGTFSNKALICSDNWMSIFVTQSVDKGNQLIKNRNRVKSNWLIVASRAERGVRFTKGGLRTPYLVVYFLGRIILCWVSVPVFGTEVIQTFPDGNQVISIERMIKLNW